MTTVSMTRDDVIRMHSQGVQNFTGANLEGTDLSNLLLPGVCFRNAWMGGVNLQGADLSYCDFTNADLGGANLEGANVNGANFTNATLKGANMPEGFVPPTTGVPYRPYGHPH